MVILGATGDQRDEVIRVLTDEGFLDDRRFAREYAHGKFRNNQWGKVKIRLELNSRGIPFGHIQEALDVIGDEEYMETIRSLAGKKYESLRMKNTSHIREKVASFCSQKGFESDLVWQAVKEISENK